MQELDDNALLREYLGQDSQAAFAALVARHINKVYSVALRHTGRPQSAEEITQAVFVILAHKADRLRGHTMLSGWLFETARLTSLTFIRGEIRRAQREKEAQVQTGLNENESDVWRQIAPLLDAALARLNEADRHAVVMRFFDGRSMQEIGAAMGTGEDAAKMRVSRALERLRKYFARHRINSTTAVLAGAISANSLQLAPLGLADAVMSSVAAKGAAISISTSTLIKGAMQIMAWTKIKTAIATGAAVLLVAGIALVAVKKMPRTAVAETPRTGVVVAAAEKSDATILQGTWAGQENGRGGGGSVSMAFQGTNIEFHGANPMEWYKATFTLREDTQPKQLVAVITDCPAPPYIGQTSYAIYQIQNGTLTLVGSEPGSPKPPADFNARNGRKFVFTRK